MSKHITDTQLIDVLGDLQTKADGRFSKGGGFVFSTDNNNNLQATKNGAAVNIGGSGSSSRLLQVTSDPISPNGWMGSYDAELPEVVNPEYYNYSCGFIVYDNKLLAIGTPDMDNWDPDGDQKPINNACREYDPIFMAWQERPDLSLPYEIVYPAGLVIYNDELHIIGGEDPETQGYSGMKHYRFDRSSNEWVFVSFVGDSTIMASMGCAILNNEIHCFASTMEETAVHYIYDGNNWRFVDDFPESIAEEYSGVIAYDDCIYVIVSTAKYYTCEYDSSNAEYFWTEHNTGATGSNVFRFNGGICSDGNYIWMMGVNQNSEAGLFRYDGNWIEATSILPGTTTGMSRIFLVFYENDIYGFEADNGMFKYIDDDGNWINYISLPNSYALFIDRELKSSSPGILIMSDDTTSEQWNAAASNNIRLYRQADFGIVLSADTIPSNEFKVTVVFQPDSIENGRLVDNLPRSGGGGSSDLPLSVENGKLCITYESDDSGGDDGVK